MRLSRFLAAASTTLLFGEAGACVGDSSATVDAGDATADASMIPDARADTTPDAGDVDVEAGSSFCATAGKHDFCADFDEATDVTVNWTSAKQSGGCAYAADVGDYKSAPRSAQLTCDATGAGGAAALDITLPANGSSHLHVELDYKLASFTFADGSQAMALFAFDDDGVTQLGMLDGADTSWFLDLPHGADGGGNVVHFQSPSTFPPIGTWTHAAFDLVLSPTSGSVSVSWNGTVAASATNIGTTPDTTLTTIGFDLSLSSIGMTSPSVTLLVDNVTVDLL